MTPQNPFDRVTDPVRYDLWERLVRVDSEAFVEGDWSRIENDFDAGNFEGVRCFTNSPDDWRIVFPRLEDYKNRWLEMSAEFRKKQFVGLTHLEAIFRRTRMNEIEIAGDRCLCHKKFSGTLDLADGTQLTGNRQTIYRLHKRAGVWRIVGFLGYLPLDEP
jgi:hypothetical protein